MPVLQFIYFNPEFSISLSFFEKKYCVHGLLPFKGGKKLDYEFDGSRYVYSQL